MKFNIIREAGLFDITYQEDQEQVISAKVSIGRLGG
jgi:hypothetical protein